MGAAGKKEMHSAMPQDSHRAIRFRPHPEQTPLANLWVDGIKAILPIRDGE
jgi:hypothetical protein